MKNCNTLNGLLKTIDKKENCCLKYISKHMIMNGNGGYLIYQVNGTSLIVSEETYNKIESYLVQI